MTVESIYFLFCNKLKYNYFKWEKINSLKKKGKKYILHGSEHHATFVWSTLLRCNLYTRWNIPYIDIKLHRCCIVHHSTTYREKIKETRLYKVENENNDLCDISFYTPWFLSHIPAALSLLTLSICNAIL